MIASRSLDDLHPVVKPLVETFIDNCRMADIDLLVTSTYRDSASQDALYAQGRTTPGQIVTNAKGGESFHNYRVAVDVVPIRDGKCVWSSLDPVWIQVAALGKAAGLEWAGDWVRFKEYPHFQYTGGLKITDFQLGKTLGETEEIPEPVGGSGRKAVGF